MERFRVIIIPRIRENNELNLNLEEVEISFNSNNLDFYRFTLSNKLALIENIIATYDTII